MPDNRWVQEGQYIRSMVDVEQFWVAYHHSVELGAAGIDPALFAKYCNPEQWSL